MTVKHIIFDANVLATIPQTETFFKAAFNSPKGAAAYIRSHCVPRTDILYILDLIQRKGIEIIVHSKTAAGAGLVLDAFGISYGRSISSLDEIEDEVSDYGYVTTQAKEHETARARGFRSVRFVPGIGQNPCEVLSLASDKQQSNHKSNDDGEEN